MAPRKRRPLRHAHVLADDDQPERYWGGRVDISNTIHPSSGHSVGSCYPDYVMLRMRLGEDGVFATAELTWREVKFIHARLGDLIKARAKLQRAVARAQDRPGVR